jgi:hypothetical protein
LNPAVLTITALTPFLAQSSRMRGTMALLTTMWARSTSSGTSRIEGKAGRSRISASLGWTGKIGPLNWWSSRFWMMR